MRTIAVIDSETDPFKKGRFPSPFIWGFYNGEEYKSFQLVSDLIDFLKDQPLIVYAHNGGKFDFHFMLDYLTPFDEVTIINGRLSRFKIGICEFRDSYNILPIPLSDYKKDDIDYSIMEASQRYTKKNKKIIADYLENDCVYLYDLVTSFIDRYGCHITQATASFKYWLKMEKRRAPVSDAAYYDVIKRFYYGGRVECFKQGLLEYPFKIADIKSAYPFAMLQAHPIGTEFDSITNPEVLETYKEVLVGNYFYMIRCTSYGAFPYRSNDGSLEFPNDDTERVYYVTGWELKAAIETNTISYYWELLELIHHYEYCDFADYVNHWYDKKKQAGIDGDKAEYIFAKLFMNSLYGKFAANPDNYSTFMVLPKELVNNVDQQLKLHQLIGDSEDENPYQFSGLLGPWALAAKDLDDENKRYYNVATSASITGFVRAYLWKAIKKTGGIIYCDTDSIAGVSFDSLDFGNELGQWEIEGEFIRGGVGGKKLYAFQYTSEWDKKLNRDWKVATKGVRLTPEQVLEVCRGKTVVFEPDHPTYSVHHEPRFISRKIKMT